MVTRVLVVEPDARLREEKEERLREAGYLVAGVGEMELARSAVELSPYPLYVLMDGEELPPIPGAALTPDSEAFYESC